MSYEMQPSVTRAQGDPKTQVSREPTPSSPSSWRRVLQAQLRRRIPQVRQAEIQLPQHLAQRLQRQPDHIVMVPFDRVDEPTTEPVDRESARHLSRLPATAVHLDLLVADVPEVHRR